MHHRRNHDDRGPRRMISRGEMRRNRWEVDVGDNVLSVLVDSHDLGRGLAFRARRDLRPKTNRLRLSEYRGVPANDGQQERKQRPWKSPARAGSSSHCIELLQFHRVPARTASGRANRSGFEADSQRRLLCSLSSSHATSPAGPVTATLPPKRLVHAAVQGSHHERGHLIRLKQRSGVDPEKVTEPPCTPLSKRRPVVGRFHPGDKSVAHAPAHQAPGSLLESLRLPPPRACRDWPDDVAAACAAESNLSEKCLGVAATYRHRDRCGS